MKLEAELDFGVGVVSKEHVRKSRVDFVKSGCWKKAPLNRNEKGDYLFVLQP